jgi:hypothetical protein
MEDAALRVIDAAFEIEGTVNRACGLSSEAAEYLDEEWGQHPAKYPTNPLSSAEASEFADLFGMPIDKLVDRLVLSRGASKSIVLQNFIADRRLEILSHAFQRHPRTLQHERRERSLLPPEEPKNCAMSVLSYLVGAAFGRWDVRIGRTPALAPSMPGLFDPVPPCPPGMLLGPDAMPIRQIPPEYPLEVPLSRLLVDEPGHQFDIETAVIRAAEALLDDPARVITELLDILGKGTMRDYLRIQFFRNHLSEYSKSRRKAPLYWPLTVQSRNWGVWIYAPELTRETIYAIASEAGRRERLASEAIARLRREQRDGDGLGARRVSEELDAEEGLAEELRLFRLEAERIAGLGWEPDLDDGIILCAAPLADLFPAWPDARTARAGLRGGMYPWARVAAWADRL